MSVDFALDYPFRAPQVCPATLPLVRVLMIDQIQDKDVPPQYRFGWIVSLVSLKNAVGEELDDYGCGEGKKGVQ